MQVLKQGQRANAGREGTSMLTVVGQEGPQEQPEPVSLLDELVRNGAQMMLVAALLAEVKRTPIGSLMSGMRTGTAWWSATATTRSGRW